MLRLLVSVRSAEECVAAVSGGADIIDVKEPNLGSLGCAAPDVIRQIADTLRALESAPPLSLALGELNEWRDDRSQLRIAIRSAAPQFLKLGLSHCVTQWLPDWVQVRNSLSGHLIKWVAVAYADAASANSPPVGDVLNAAIESRCEILLLDTHTKDGTSLLDHIAPEDLESLRTETLKHGLRLALAGQVSLRNLPQILAIKPDIIAVRGAVCEGGQRTSIVTARRVQQFRDAMISANELAAPY